MSGGPFVELHGRECGFDLATRRLFVRAKPFTVTASPAAGSSNVSLVTLQIVDRDGNAVATVANMDVWLSDAADGGGLTATTASGSVAAGASGTDLVDYVSKKAKRVQTDNTGKYILSITDTAKTAFKVCAQLGEGAGAIVAATLATGNYG